MKNDLLVERNDIFPIYFFVKKYYNQRIKRSKQWFANVKDEIKRTWDLVRRLQEDKTEFEKYKDSIHRIKSKKFYEKYHQTECEIYDDDSTYIFNEESMSIEIDIEDTENIKDTVCLID